MPVLDQEVVEGEGQLSIDRGPVFRFGRLHHDRAVQAHLLPEVLADVGVVPVEPRIGELDLVGERSFNQDRLLGLVRDPVVAVLQPQPVPVHGRVDGTLVRHLDSDLRALIDVQGRAGNRSVVGEHAHVGALDGLPDRSDPEIKAVAVPHAEDARSRSFRKSCRFCREQIPCVVLGWLLHLESPSPFRMTMRQDRSTPDSGA